MRLKKVCGEHAQSMRRTGGGPAEALPTLSPTDQRLVSVLDGMEFAERDSHAATNSFHTPPITFPVAIEASQIVAEAPPVAVPPACRSENILIIHEAAETVNTIPMTAERERSPVRTYNNQRSRARQGRQLNDHLDQFGAIEQNRVTAATVTAEALREAVGSISSVAVAINNLAAAVTEAAKISAQAINSNK